MNNRKTAYIVALRAMARRAYEAEGDMEKLMGEALGEELGITDAPKKFFEEAKKKLNKSLKEEGIDFDPEDDDIYDNIRRIVLETADEMDMIK